MEQLLTASHGDAFIRDCFIRHGHDSTGDHESMTAHTLEVYLHTLMTWLSHGYSGLRMVCGSFCECSGSLCTLLLLTTNNLHAEYQYMYRCLQTHCVVSPIACSSCVATDILLFSIYIDASQTALFFIFTMMWLWHGFPKFRVERLSA